MHIQLHARTARVTAPEEENPQHEVIQMTRFTTKTTKSQMFISQRHQHLPRFVLSDLKILNLTLPTNTCAHVVTQISNKIHVFNKHTQIIA